MSRNRLKIKESDEVTPRLIPAPGYEQLVAVFRDAHDQAAYGKGNDRHARGQPFHEQRMQTIAKLQRSPKGMEFQVHKKVSEGLELPDPKARRAELLGAINYLAGIVIYLDGEVSDEIIQGGSNNDH